LVSFMVKRLLIVKVLTFRDIVNQPLRVRVGVSFVEYQLWWFLKFDVEEILML